MSEVPTKICFVCLGNICRSPTAEAVFRHLISEAEVTDQFEIDSAGTAAYHVGSPPDSRSAAAARDRGIELTGRARQFVVEDFERFDYVVAMDVNNRDDLLELASTAVDRDKVSLLRDFDPESPPGSSVPDPYYGGDKGFDKVLDICQAGCTGLLRSIQPRR